MVDKKVLDLDIGEITHCIQSGKFDGVSIGRDENGFFVCTHRARSKSYETFKKIPDYVIKFICSTGVSLEQHGIYFTSKNAEMILSGEKDLMINSRSCAQEKSVLLITEIIERSPAVEKGFFSGIAIAEITLKPSYEISHQVFEKLQDRHRIDKDNTKLLSAEKLYAYEFEIKEILKPFKLVKIPHGVQDWIDDVQFIEERKKIEPSLKSVPTQAIEVLENLQSTLDESFGAKIFLAIEEKFDGCRFQLHRQDKKVGLFTEDKLRDRSNILPDLVAEAKKLPVAEVILDGEIVWWIQDKPRPRRENMPIIVGKEPIKNEDIRFNVFDCLWYNGKDLTQLPWSERQKYLKKVLPKEGKHFKRVKPIIVQNEKEFEKAIEKVSDEKGSEGAMIKSVNSTYSKTRTSNWAKIKPKIKEIKVKIIGRRKVPAGVPKDKKYSHEEMMKKLPELLKKSGTWTYRVAILNGKKLIPIDADKTLTQSDLTLKWDSDKAKWKGLDDPGQWEMIKGFSQREASEYSFGNTYNIKLEPEPQLGDIITIAPVLMRKFYGKDGKQHISHTFPRVTHADPERDKPDTMDQVRRIVKASPKSADAVVKDTEEELPKKKQRELEEKFLYGDIYMIEQKGTKLSKFTIMEHIRGIMTQDMKGEFLDVFKKIKKTSNKESKAEDFSEYFESYMQKRLEKIIKNAIAYREKGIDIENQIQELYEKVDIYAPDSQEGFASLLQKVFENNDLFNESWSEYKKSFAAEKKSMDPQIAFNRLWRSFGLSVLDGTIENLKKAAQAVDDVKKNVSAKDVSVTIKSFLDFKAPSINDFDKLVSENKVMNQGNIHLDWRNWPIGFNFLVGWTLTDIKSVIQNFKDLKIEKVLRSKILDNKPDDKIQAIKKALQPMWWYHEVVTPQKKEREIEPGDIGATIETGAMFVFIDRGELLWGISKTDFHEYFYFWDHYKDLNGRWGVQFLGGREEYEKVPKEGWWMMNLPTEQRPYILTHTLAETEKKAKEEKIKVVLNEDVIPALGKLGYKHLQPSKKVQLESELSNFKGGLN